MQRILDRKILPAAVVPSADLAVPLARRAPCRRPRRDGNHLPQSASFAMHRTNPAQRFPKCSSALERCSTFSRSAKRSTAVREFGLTPGFNPTVIHAASAAKLPLIPGVLTPGEMERAVEVGCPTVKFFPAEAAGGIAFLKAIAAPYAHTALRIIPLGGIGPKNLRDYLALPIVGAVGGSWLGSTELVGARDWGRITARCARRLHSRETSVAPAAPPCFLPHGEAVDRTLRSA